MQIGKELKGYKPIKDVKIPAVQVWKEPDLEGALFSVSHKLQSRKTRSKTVISMVGGYDFAQSECNRATQAQRQVGSTFKPIVYAAGIESKNSRCLINSRCSINLSNIWGQTMET